MCCNRFLIYELDHYKQDGVIQIDRVLVVKQCNECGSEGENRGSRKVCTFDPRSRCGITITVKP